ncbi:MAG: secondary thiamine-phosphate synthase enzyme YjbQ [Candidatus Omnitrophota bacterium]
MKIVTKSIKIPTKGDPDLIDITAKVAGILDSANIKEGSATVFVVGSTAAIATFEYEPGLVKDIKELFEKMIPRSKHYNHDETWGDANGFSHLRASLKGPSLVVPFREGKLVLGTWQQIVLAEFDNRPRQREVVVQLIGE